MQREEASSEEMEANERQAVLNFESAIGTRVRNYETRQVGTQEFLYITVGRKAPVYLHALARANRGLPNDNPYKGLLATRAQRESDEKFPQTLEADVLGALLAASTRKVSQGGTGRGFQVPYVPFQNGEDHKVAQPATQLIVGRRGVGKSTLISRARDILRSGPDVSLVLDMETYSALRGENLVREVLYDTFAGLAAEFPVSTSAEARESCDAALLEIGEFGPAGLGPKLKRRLKAITTCVGGHFYLFLDDFHLVEPDEQPTLLTALHTVLKGADGWLKVAGVESLLNSYDSGRRTGLQSPGDAQLVSLDLTLENPKAAEKHLGAILESFLHAVGYTKVTDALARDVFRRLVWANAGVPRDFLQMFGRSLVHASKSGGRRVSMGDLNVAIGEFGQRKIDEMRLDSRGHSDHLSSVLDSLKDFCMAKQDPPVNAFLVRADSEFFRHEVRKISDLRFVHLIHQSITPDRAGEAYRAYILDYALFTGLRRKRNVQEMLPPDGEQFRAADLRRLPKVTLALLEGSEGLGRAAVGTASEPRRQKKAAKKKAAKRKAAKKKAVKKKAVKKKAVKKKAVKKKAVKKKAVKGKAVKGKAVKGKKRAVKKKAVKKKAVKKKAVKKKAVKN